MRNSTLCATLAALLLGVGSASAHHAFARDFNQDKPVALNGAVTKVEWTNPHVYTWIDVKDTEGKTTNWKVEMGSPNELTKAGWTRTKLMVGQMVSLQGWQAKDGSNFANAEDMTVDGQKLSAVSSHDDIKPIATSGKKQPAPTDKKQPPPTDTKSPSSPKY